MSQVWVLRRQPQTARTPEAYSRLVRADAIRNPKANERRVLMDDLGSETRFALAVSDQTQSEAPLPTDFHLSLLTTLTRARPYAERTGNDQVVIAEFDSGGWQWIQYGLAQLD